MVILSRLEQKDLKKILSTLDKLVKEARPAFPRTEYYKALKSAKLILKEYYE